MRTLLAACATLMVTAVLAAGIHGETDAFSRDGVRLAWAILRGKDEATTRVVVRIVADPGIKALTVKGQDPFTKAERTFFEKMPLSATHAEVRLSRAGFADFPRTEWHFLGADGHAMLHVYYLGIPDTTPEFLDEQRLTDYLKARVAK